MSVVVMLGQLIHHIQRERDMSVLYLSDLGPGTKTFLLAEYMATDDALQKLTIWPGGLQVHVGFSMCACSVIKASDIGHEYYI